MKIWCHIQTNTNYDINTETVMSTPEKNKNLVPKIKRYETFFLGDTTQTIQCWYKTGSRGYATQMIRL